MIQTLPDSRVLPDYVVRFRQAQDKLAEICDNKIIETFRREILQDMKHMDIVHMLQITNSKTQTEIIMMMSEDFKRSFLPVWMNALGYGRLQVECSSDYLDEMTEIRSIFRLPVEDRKIALKIYKERNEVRAHMRIAHLKTLSEGDLSKYLENMVDGSIVHMFQFMEENFQQDCLEQIPYERVEKLLMMMYEYERQILPDN
jgi:Mg/Co/Ni transporter MgtE